MDVHYSELLTFFELDFLSSIPKKSIASLDRSGLKSSTDALLLTAVPDTGGITAQKRYNSSTLSYQDLISGYEKVDHMIWFEQGVYKESLKERDKFVVVFLMSMSAQLLSEKTLGAIIYLIDWVSYTASTRQPNKYKVYFMD